MDTELTTLISVWERISPFFFYGQEVLSIAKPNNGNQMINDDIKFDKVRLIDADGQMVGVVDLAVAESASGFGGDRLAGCRVLPYDREAVRNRGGVTRRVHVERQGEGTRHVHGFLPPD